MSPADALAELLRLLEHPPVPFPLDRAALLLAVDAYPELDLRRYESRLDEYAGRVAEAAGPTGDPRRRLTALRRVLFEDEGFHGNREEYYDVRNSYLNEVLDRKLGIPISLATVVAGVARRLDWPLEGVNFPYHFLLRYRQSGEPLAIDPFHGGLILGEEELEERWRLTTGTPAPDLEQMLAPAQPRDVLLRMLNNIQGIYLRDQRHARAASVTEWMASLQPGYPLYDRDAGYLYLAAQDLHAAARCLRRYLERVPQAPEAEQVRDHLAMIQEHLPES